MMAMVTSTGLMRMTTIASMISKMRTIRSLRKRKFLKRRYPIKK